MARNLLLISFTVETFFASYGLFPYTQTSFASILYFMAGLGLVFSLLFLPEARLDLPLKRRPAAIWIKCGLTGGMLFLAYITSRYWFSRIPIDPDFADMLPVINVMDERFLSGHWKQIYDPIAGISHGMIPIYLPAMWLPYSAALLLHLDIRWTTVIALLISFGSFLFLLRISKKNFHSYLLMAVAGMFFWWIFSRDDMHGLISLSEEGPVILYYVLLCVAIVSGNIYFIGIMASLCLLSRYSLIGWLIPYLFFLICRKDYKKGIVFFLTGLFFFLLFFLLPFGEKPVLQGLRLPATYMPFASKVWTTAPEVFWLNLGFAKFFGPHRVILLHKMLILCSFGIPFLFIFFCLWQKKRRLNNIPLATLKLSLIVFYQLIDVPYGYLFYTSSFVSLAIVALVFRSEGEMDLSVHRPPA